MKIDRIKPGQSYEPTVVALGNFDGVHLGHQQLLRCGLEKAKTLKVSLSVLLFDPHPLKVFYPERKMNLLTGQVERLKLFEEFGVDQVFLFPFSLEFAQTTPEDFVRSILLKIGAVQVIVGFNYSFGCRGQGSPTDLKILGQVYGFRVSVIGAQKLDDQIISSTEIRRYLLNGDIAMAKKMMGRSPKIVGKVIHGEQRGRTLGFPTANIQTDADLLIPKNGVYAVTAQIDGVRHQAMMNIGFRPTFSNEEQRTIEVHFLNYHGDLYGQNLNISIEARLRSERKFTSIEEMILQLNQDKQEAASVLTALQKG